ncbi:DNA-directed RNA polymerase III subunit RPC10 [Talaromyces proteolyticus]|uniref:DNA-directed RNA polymerase subunit n=1 Tax=Talaromyces proteolyticus TaxID=1131652 RepID=A0AAD4KI33_9EURO|nr:DNA-directed RNA polymerase III subunit RPC10 [Talaromyces proteolyticus]KAH8692753.1 DNA-directed RNA polymerase III subunit RPC10 [Talaromyces proteolyticus]
MPLTFCPNCSNVLTISRAEPTASYPLGVNRFECHSCPYQHVIDTMYYEKRTLKQKEAEDVMGGKKMWENADSMEGELKLGENKKKINGRIVTLIIDFCLYPVQCPNEGCTSDRAYFRQLQIRSADEPMTTFLKCTVCEAEWRD